MKNRIMVLVAIGFALLIAGSALAGTSAIFTPAVQIGLAGDGLRCYVLNTGTTDINGVTIQIIDDSGTVKATGSNEFVPAGHISSHGLGGTLPASAYCKVSGISAKTARVTLIVEDSDGNAVAIVTSP
jgi:hypothetical protein